MLLRTKVRSKTEIRERQSTHSSISIHVVKSAKDPSSQLSLRMRMMKLISVFRMAEVDTGVKHRNTR